MTARSKRAAAHGSRVRPDLLLIALSRDDADGEGLPISLGLARSLDQMDGGAQRRDGMWVSIGSDGVVHGRASEAARGPARMADGGRSRRPRLLRVETIRVVEYAQRGGAVEDDVLLSRRLKDSKGEERG